MDIRDIFEQASQGTALDILLFNAGKKNYLSEITQRLLGNITQQENEQLQWNFSAAMAARFLVEAEYQGTEGAKGWFTAFDRMAEQVVNSPASDTASKPDPTLSGQQGATEIQDISDIEKKLRAQYYRQPLQLILEKLRALPDDNQYPHGLNAPLVTDSHAMLTALAEVTETTQFFFNPVYVRTIVAVSIHCRNDRPYQWSVFIPEAGLGKVFGSYADFHRAITAVCNALSGLSRPEENRPTGASFVVKINEISQNHREQHDNKWKSILANEFAWLCRELKKQRTIFRLNHAISAEVTGYLWEKQYNNTIRVAAVEVKITDKNRAIVVTVHNPVSNFSSIVENIRKRYCNSQDWVTKTGYSIDMSPSAWVHQPVIHPQPAAENSHEQHYQVIVQMADDPGICKKIEKLAANNAHRTVVILYESKNGIHKIAHGNLAILRSPQVRWRVRWQVVVREGPDGLLSGQRRNTLGNAIEILQNKINLQQPHITLVKIRNKITDIVAQTSGPAQEAHLPARADGTRKQDSHARQPPSAVEIPQSVSTTIKQQPDTAGGKTLIAFTATPLPGSEHAFGNYNQLIQEILHKYQCRDMELFQLEEILPAVIRDVALQAQVSTLPSVALENLLGTLVEEMYRLPHLAAGAPCGITALLALIVKELCALEAVTTLAEYDRERLLLLLMEKIVSDNAVAGLRPPESKELLAVIMKEIVASAAISCLSPASQGKIIVSLVEKMVSSCLVKPLRRAGREELAFFLLETVMSLTSVTHFSNDTREMLFATLMEKMIASSLVTDLALDDRKVLLYALMEKMASLSHGRGLSDDEQVNLLTMLTERIITSTTMENLKPGDRKEVMFMLLAKLASLDSVSTLTQQHKGRLFGALLENMMSSKAVLDLRSADRKQFLCALVEKSLSFSVLADLHFPERKTVIIMLLEKIAALQLTTRLTHNNQEKFILAVVQHITAAWAVTSLRAAYRKTLLTEIGEKIMSLPLVNAFSLCRKKTLQASLRQLEARLDPVSEETSTRLNTRFQPGTSARKNKYPASAETADTTAAKHNRTTDTHQQATTASVQITAYETPVLLTPAGHSVPFTPSQSHADTSDSTKSTVNPGTQATDVEISAHRMPPKWLDNQPANAGQENVSLWQSLDIVAQGEPVHAPRLILQFENEVREEVLALLHKYPGSVVVQMDISDRMRVWSAQGESLHGSATAALTALRKEKALSVYVVGYGQHHDIGSTNTQTLGARTPDRLLEQVLTASAYLDLQPQKISLLACHGASDHSQNSFLHKLAKIITERQEKLHKADAVIRAEQSTIARLLASIRELKGRTRKMGILPDGSKVTQGSDGTTQFKETGNSIMLLRNEQGEFIQTDNLQIAVEKTKALLHELLDGKITLAGLNDDSLDLLANAFAKPLSGVAEHVTDRRLLQQSYRTMTQLKTLLMECQTLSGDEGDLPMSMPQALQQVNKLKQALLEVITQDMAPAAVSSAQTQNQQTKTLTFARKLLEKNRQNHFIRIMNTPPARAVIQTGTHFMQGMSLIQGMNALDNGHQLLQKGILTAFEEQQLEADMAMIKAALLMESVEEPVVPLFSQLGNRLSSASHVPLSGAGTKNMLTVSRWLIKIAPLLNLPDVVFNLHALHEAMVRSAHATTAQEKQEILTEAIFSGASVFSALGTTAMALNAMPAALPVAFVMTVLLFLAGNIWNGVRTLQELEKRLTLHIWDRLELFCYGMSGTPLSVHMQNRLMAANTQEQAKHQYQEEKALQARIRLSNEQEAEVIYYEQGTLVTTDTGRTYYRLRVPGSFWQQVRAAMKSQDVLFPDAHHATEAILRIMNAEETADSSTTVVDCIPPWLSDALRQEIRKDAWLKHFLQKKYHTERFSLEKSPLSVFSTTLQPADHVFSATTATASMQIQRRTWGNVNIGSRPVWGNFDSNGLDACWRTAENLYLFLSDAHGHYRRLSVPGNAALQAVLTGRLNASDRQDSLILVAVTWQDKGVRVIPDRICVQEAGYYSSPLQEIFLSTGDIAIENQDIFITPLDLDNDGNLDIVITVNKRIYVQYGDGQGGFNAPGSGEFRWPETDPRWSYAQILTALFAQNQLIRQEPGILAGVNALWLFTADGSVHILQGHRDREKKFSIVPAIESATIANAGLWLSDLDADGNSDLIVKDDTGAYQTALWDKKNHTLSRLQHRTSSALLRYPGVRQTGSQQLLHNTLPWFPDGQRLVLTGNFAGTGYQEIALFSLTGLLLFTADTSGDYGAADIHLINEEFIQLLPTLYQNVTEQPDSRHQLCVADVNGDRRDDIVIILRSGWQRGGKTQLYILLSVTDESSSRFIVHKSDISAEETLLSDNGHNLLVEINGDGIVDLLVMERVNRAAGMAPVRLGYGNGNGGFTPVSLSFAPDVPAWISCGYHYDWQLTGRINTDRCQDLLFVSAKDDKSLYVYGLLGSEERGKLTALAEWQLPLIVNATVVQALLADMAGDWRDELLVLYDNGRFSVTSWYQTEGVLRHETVWSDNSLLLPGETWNQEHILNVEQDEQGRRRLRSISKEGHIFWRLFDSPSNLVIYDLGAGDNTIVAGNNRSLFLAGSGNNTLTCSASGDEIRVTLAAGVNTRVTVKNIHNQQPPLINITNLAVTEMALHADGQNLLITHTGISQSRQQLCLDSFISSHNGVYGRIRLQDKSGDNFELGTDGRQAYLYQGKLQTKAADWLLMTEDSRQLEMYASTSEIISIKGTADDDQIICRGKTQTRVRGEKGDDVIRGGQGNNWMDGGEGDDWLITGAQGSRNIIRFALGYGHDIVSASAACYTRIYLAGINREELGLEFQGDDLLISIAGSGTDSMRLKNFSDWQGQTWVSVGSWQLCISTPVIKDTAVTAQTTALNGHQTESAKTRNINTQHWIPLSADADDATPEPAGFAFDENTLTAPHEQMEFPDNVDAGRQSPAAQHHVVLEQILLIDTMANFAVHKENSATPAWSGMNAHTSRPPSTTEALNDSIRVLPE